MDPTAHHEQPIAIELRPALRAVVEAFRHGDYAVRRSVPMVAPVRDAVAEQIAEYIEDYGETLATLPDETWSTSVSCWMDGYWDILVDLWTEESGRSDLTLSARVYPEREGHVVEIRGVWVP